MKESMFCFQCQETAKGTGCTVRGVCGKNSTTSARMDLLALCNQRNFYCSPHLTYAPDITRSTSQCFCHRRPLFDYYQC